MNEMMQNKADETAIDNAPAVQNDGSGGKDTEFSVSREYFGPDGLEKAQARVGEIFANIEKLGLTGDDILSNFGEDFFETDAAKGYGISIVPVSKRSETGEGNVLQFICVAAMPDPVTVQETEKGASWLHEIAVAEMSAKIAQTARSIGKGETATFPLSIMDFVENRKSSGGLTTFNEIAPPFVKWLKSQGLKAMTQKLLRECLSSKAFAEETFSGVSQTVWETMLDRMIAKAEKENLPTAVLTHWKETRDQAIAREIEIDETALSGLDDI